MRIGNTTEREAPWKLEFSLDRLKPRNWKRPYLVWLQLLLKLLPWFVMTFGAPVLRYIEKGEGYLVDNNHAEINAACFTFLALIDFFITKNVLGPKLTGLHHGFKMDEERKITYHFYAEKKFWIPFSILGFISVYLNLYLFVQVRYYKQWTMMKFFSAWAYNFFIRIDFMNDDNSESNFRNTYYDNRAKY